jgi:hypothetical protein
LRHFCLKVEKNVSNYLKMSQSILSQSNRKCLKLFCAPALQNDLYVRTYVKLELLPGLPDHKNTFYKYRFLCSGTPRNRKI